MKAKLSLLSLSLLVALASCNEDSATIGGDIMPKSDGLTTSHALYTISTKSVKTGAITGTTTRGFLGNIVDPETKARTTSGFLAQFHVEDNTTLPPIGKMVTNAEGKVEADSCVMYINHDSYFGDSLNVMKLSVHELDKSKALSEASTYRTDLDPSQYLMGAGAERKTVSYTALDQTKSQSVLNNTNLYRQVSVRLSRDFGTNILRHYYAHPAHFKNSYEFARNVCAGFYFKHAGGVGTMLSSPITTLNVYYRQHTKGATGNDTIVNTVLRVGSTEEVIQTSNFSTDLPEELLADDKGYTYVKSPAGIHTELTIPVGEVVGGEHYNDTINSARFMLRVHQSASSSKYRLQPSEHLLLLPKQQLESFFEGSALPDDTYAYLASSVKGAYVFNNVAPLISALRIARDKGAGVLPTDSPAVRQQKWAVWEAAHPDWNKMLLLPVSGDYSAVGSGLQKERALQRLRHNFNLTSLRLEGGSKNPIELSVIYSRFRQ